VAVDWPVIVIGGGVSGMAVAAELGDALLIDGAATLGGRVPSENASLFFVGIDDQFAMGFDDSVDEAADDWLELTGGAPTPMTLAYFAALPEIYDRLVELGVQMGALDNDPILDKPRNLASSGLVSSMEAALGEGIEVWTETWVESLVFEEGAVVGVVVEGQTIIADHVVIATGGFAGNAELVEEVAGDELLDDSWGVAEDGGSSGQALLWASEFGLGSEALSSIGWMRRSLGMAGAESTPAAIDYEGQTPWIWVNALGDRFVDESSNHSVMLSTPYRANEPVWAVTTDAILWEVTDEADQELLEAEMDAGGRVVCADSFAALAELIEVDADGLALTLDAIEAVRDGDTQDAFFRPAQSFASFEQGDPCAFITGQRAEKSYGGLAIDDEGGVLDAEGNRVNGLWAVGEAAGMLAPGVGGDSGWDGSLTAVVWSGWRVGNSIRDRDSE